MEFDLAGRGDRAFEPQVDLGELSAGVVLGVGVGHRHQPRHLGERFADEHARHDGVAREVAGEKRFATRRRPDAKMEAQIHVVGLMMLLGLMLYVTIFNDFALGK